MDPQALRLYVVSDPDLVGQRSVEEVCRLALAADSCARSPVTTSVLPVVNLGELLIMRSITSIFRALEHQRCCGFAVRDARPEPRWRARRA